MGLPTAGFIVGISTLEKYRLHAMARVSRHNLGYKCLGTYLAMHVCASELIMRNCNRNPP